MMFNKIGWFISVPIAVNKTVCIQNFLKLRLEMGCKKFNLGSKNWTESREFMIISRKYQW